MVNRLTTKRGNQFISNSSSDSNLDTCNTSSQTCVDNCINKLGKIEDLEEDLGIDIITLYAAIKNGFYYLYNNIIYWKEPYSIDINYYKEVITNYLFSDYGKSWALTKEELIKYVR